MFSLVLWMSLVYSVLPNTPYTHDLYNTKLYADWTAYAATYCRQLSEDANRALKAVGTFNTTYTCDANGDLIP